MNWWSGREDIRKMEGRWMKPGFLELSHGKIVLTLIKKVPGDD